MKKILVTQRLILHDAYHEIRDTLDVSFANLFSLLPALPILASSHIDPELYFREHLLDGVLLTGGNDLGVVKDCPLSHKRDAFERKIVELAIAQQLPILGICRGMQLIAHYFQSTLCERPGHVRCNHTLSLAEGKYSELLSEIHTVNSYHNYGIDQLGPSLRPIAHAPDGSSEAIEHESLPILGIAWHPERDELDREGNLTLLRKFFDIKEYTL